jgi:hypothetical protein
MTVTSRLRGNVAVIFNQQISCHVRSKPGAMKRSLISLEFLLSSFWLGDPGIELLIRSSRCSKQPPLLRKIAGMQSGYEPADRWKDQKRLRIE